MAALYEHIGDLVALGDADATTKAYQEAGSQKIWPIIFCVGFYHPNLYSCLWPKDLMHFNTFSYVFSHVYVYQKSTCWMKHFLLL